MQILTLPAIVALFDRVISKQFDSVGLREKSVIQSIGLFLLVRWISVHCQMNMVNNINIQCITPSPGLF